MPVHCNYCNYFGYHFRYGKRTFSTARHSRRTQQIRPTTCKTQRPEYTQRSRREMGSGGGWRRQLFVTGDLHLWRDNGASRTRARSNRETDDIAWRVPLRGEPCPRCFLRVEEGVIFSFLFFCAIRYCRDSINTLTNHQKKEPLCLR